MGHGASPRSSRKRVSFTALATGRWHSDFSDGFPGLVDSREGREVARRPSRPKIGTIYEIGARTLRTQHQHFRDGSVGLELAALPPQKEDCRPSDTIIF